jgi:hypothetical protein
MLSPLFEVPAHDPRARPFESARIVHHSELESAFLEQVQSIVKVHRLSNPGVETLEARFPCRIVAVGAAVYDNSPNTMAVFAQLILKLIGNVEGAVTARTCRRSEFWTISCKAVYRAMSKALECLRFRLR